MALSPSNRPEEKTARIALTALIIHLFPRLLPPDWFDFPAPEPNNNPLNNVTSVTGRRHVERVPKILEYGGHKTMPHKITFSIGDAATMAGVTQRQIRDWEAWGYIPKAQRLIWGDRAYRRFSMEQIEMIKKVKEYQDQGFTLQAAARKAKQAL
jgi:hypothetical protein